MCSAFGTRVTSLPLFINAFKHRFAFTRNRSTNDNVLNASSNVVGQQIIISDNCVAKLKRVAQRDEFLRVEVESGGCSGFQYKFKLDSTLNDDDKVFEKNGVKVVVDETSLQFISGSVVDYNVELIRSAFQVTSNPKAEHGCSCGASFTVKIS